MFQDTADIAQLGERQTEDLKVPGSIPGVGNLFCILFLQCEQIVGTRTSYHGILAEWLRRLIRNQLGTFPREFESLRCRFVVFCNFCFLLTISDVAPTHVRVTSSSVGVRRVQASGL